MLANDWLPPVALGRQREVDEIVRRLDPPAPRAPPPWVVGVAGPSGAGVSTVARRAAREVADRLRAARPDGTPRIVDVRAAVQRGTHGVASGLLRRLDDGFDGRGFSTVEILAGFLRRLRRDGRPVVLVLDDARIGGPDLAPVLRAVADPDRFLPEGEHGLPPLYTIVAGSAEALSSLAVSVGGRFPFDPFVSLGPYDGPTLEAIVRDRADRAFGRPAPAALIGRVVRRSVEDGGGTRRALDLLRRELLGPAYGSLGPELRRALGVGVSVEPRVVRAIGAASGKGAARLGEVRRLEAEIARAQGLRPLPTTTLWRRIVRLEQAGYVRREIRPGGIGGSRSLLRVLTPIDEWVMAPRPRETLRGYERWGESEPWRGEGPSGPIRPGAGPPPSDDPAD